MGLPIRLNHKPTAWRSNQFVIPIRCWLDRAKTQPLDLSRFGPTWNSQVRLSYGDVLAATFTVTKVFNEDEVFYGIDLGLSGSITAALTEPYYVFDVEVTGGGISPLTVFLGGFQVDGDVTRP